MRNQGMIYIAIFIIVAGVLLLAGNLFDVNVGAFCWPIGLILLGVFFIMRPRMTDAGDKSHMVLIGDIERAGPGELPAEEFWGFIVDANFDLTKFDIPPGETIIRGYSFIGDSEIFAPAGVGVAVDSSAFITSFKLDGGEEESYLLSPMNWKSDGYKMAERRVRFELSHFISDVKLRRF